MNQALPSLPGGSLEITFKASLITSRTLEIGRSEIKLELLNVFGIQVKQLMNL